MQIDLPACQTLIVGRSGSGKTTFALRYLLNVSAACRFIFDDRGQAAARLRLRPARTAIEVEEALATHWVCFDPHGMFPGRLPEAFRWFCAWCYDVSQRGPGKKVLLVDEVWRWCDSWKIPQELANIVQTGRIHGLELCCCTQMPNKLPEAITNEATELVCFSLQGANGLDRVADKGADSDAVAALPKGSFLAYNCDSGRSLAERLF